MPRTIQKKIKFTKGMVTKSLAERNDLPMYDSSAELIRNYVCTPYGGFRTRRGTRLIQKLDLAEKIYFPIVDDKTSGSYQDHNYISGSLSGLKDSDVIAVFDLGIENLKSEANIYLSNIRLDYKKPSLTAHFTSTGVQYQAKLTGIDINDGGIGFEGNLSVNGTILSGNTVINPTINNLGTITSVDFESAVYKYMPENPQDVVVSANYPKCVIGISTSLDNNLWSEEIKYDISSTPLSSIKLASTNLRYMRIRYYGSKINNRISIDNIFAKYEFYKLIPFVYNVAQRNMIVLSEKKILIFENGKQVKEIAIPKELYFKNIRSVKWSQNEDVIVFTEAGVKPRELRRTLDDWTFTAFDVKNIPFHNFGTPKEEKKTVGITPNYVSGAVTITADSDVFSESSVGQQIDGNGGRLKITEYVTNRKVIGYTIIPFLNEEK